MTARRARAARRVHGREPARQARPARVRPARRLRARPGRGARPLRLLLRPVPRGRGGRMTERLRTAIVGCGAIAHWHLDAIDRAGVPMTVDRRGRSGRRERANGSRRAPAPPRIASLDAALDAGGFEAALIAVPHHLHEPVATDGARAPACTCCSRSRSRRRSTRATGSSTRPRAAGTVFMVAENAQYWPEVPTVRDADRRRRDRRGRHRARGDVLPRARRLLRRRPPVAVRPGGRGRRRGDRHRLALAPAAARVARRGRRGRRRARPSRSAHGGRVAVPRAAAVRVGHRSRRSTRCSTTGGIAPQPLFTVTGTTGELTVEGSGWVKLWDGTDWKGTKVGEQGGYLRSYEAELADFAVGGAARHARRRPPPSTRSASCGSRSRCTGRRRAAAGRRSGHDAARPSTSRARTCSSPAERRASASRSRARSATAGAQRDRHRHPRRRRRRTTSTSRRSPTGSAG